MRNLTKIIILILNRLYGNPALITREGYRWALVENWTLENLPDGRQSTVPAAVGDGTL